MPRESTGSPSLDLNKSETTKIDSSIIDTIARLLVKFVAQNGDVTSRQSAAYAPFVVPWTYDWVEIVEYVNRLREWISCGPESYVVAVCLLKRLEAAGAIPSFTQKSIHRIFFTALVLGVKVMEDETLLNSDFAKVGCVTPAQLFEMELHAFKALKFSCYVSPAEFDECCRELRLAETCFQTNNMKPFARHGVEPLSINQVMKELKPPAPARRVSLFGLHRTKTATPRTSTSSKPTEPKASSPRTAQNPPPAVRRTTSLGVILNKKLLKPAATVISAVSAPQSQAPAAKPMFAQKATPRVLLRQDSI